MKKKKKKKVHKRKGLVSAFPPWPSSSRKQNMPSPRQQTESWCRCRTRRSFSGILRSVWTPAVAPPSAHWMTHNFFVRPQFLENHLKNSFCTAFKLERATLHLMIFMCGVQNTSGSPPTPDWPMRLPESLKASVFSNQWYNNVANCCCTAARLRAAGFKLFLQTVSHCAADTSDTFIFLSGRLLHFTDAAMKILANPVMCPCTNAFLNLY